MRMPTATMLGKRVSEIDKLFIELLGHPESHFFPSPEELPAVPPSSNPPSSGPAGVSMDVGREFTSRPLSSSQPPGHADGPTDVGQPPPSVPEETSKLSNPDHAPLGAGNELNEIWFDFSGHPENDLFEKPEEPLDARPSSSSHQPGPAVAGTDVDPNQPLPSTSKEPPPVSSSVDESNGLSLHLFGRPGSYFRPEPGELSATQWNPSSNSHLSRPAIGGANIKPLLPPIPKGPSPVSSSGDEEGMLLPNFFGRPGSYFLKKPGESSAIHWPLPPSSPSIPKDPEPGKLWPNFFGPPGSYFIAKPGESSAAHWHPSSSSQPPRPAVGGTEIKQLLPPIPKKQSAASSSGDESDKLLPDLFGRPGSYFLVKPGEPTATHWRPFSRPADGWTDVKKPLSPIPEEPSPVTSPDNIPPSPGSLTESQYELMDEDVPSGPSDPALALPIVESDYEMDTLPSSSSPTTNLDPQWMGVGSSSGKRKMPWGT